MMSNEWIPLEFEQTKDKFGFDFAKFVGEYPVIEQEILVTTTKGEVEVDVYYGDEEFMRSGRIFEEDIVAWMMCPEAYRRDKK